MWGMCLGVEGVGCLEAGGISEAWPSWNRPTAHDMQLIWRLVEKISAKWVRMADAHYCGLLE